MKEMVQKGYSDIYLKDRSHLHLNEQKAEPVKEVPSKDKSPKSLEIIKYKRMFFEGRGYSGLHFTAGDIDYLAARVYFEPLNTTRKLQVQSQIFDGEDTFSKVFKNEYPLSLGATNFKTTGWGNNKFNSYSDGIYKWEIELDEKNTAKISEFMMESLRRMV